MNRAMRRALGMKKKMHTNWTCPNCATLYPVIYDQATDIPYIFCHKGCNHFFDHQGDDVTNKVYPNGLPWEKESENK